MNGRLLRSVALVALAVGGLSACLSTPGAERVARDVVESMDITEEQRECMLRKLDGYSNEELEAIGEGVLDSIPEAEEQLDVFQADLAGCLSGSR